MCTLAFHGESHPPSPSLSALAAPGDSYTNFQECLPPLSLSSFSYLPSVPFVPSVESPFLGSPSALHPAQGTSHAGFRVSIATWGRVFAYYTLCVTSRLVMYARIGVGLHRRCIGDRVYVFLRVWVFKRTENHMSFPFARPCMRSCARYERVSTRLSAIGTYCKGIEREV